MQSWIVSKTDNVGLKQRPLTAFLGKVWGKLFHCTQRVFERFENKQTKKQIFNLCLRNIRRKPCNVKQIVRNQAEKRKQAEETIKRLFRSFTQ